MKFEPFVDFTFIEFYINLMWLYECRMRF